MIHYIPKREKDKHVPTTLCICAPRLVHPVGDLTGEKVYYEHFALDGAVEKRQVYQ